MGFSINTNIDALNTYRNLQGVQNSLSNSLAKLSSGLRINNAGDDAAGLTIATQLGSQVSGLTQAARNAQDGVSVVQTADGALTQTQSLLGRLRDLAVQAANDSNSADARSAIKKEADSITSELSRLSSSVNFNGKKLLDGSTNNMKFQVGADGDTASQITVDLSGANLSSISSALSTKSKGLGLDATALADLTGDDGITFTSTTKDGTADDAATLATSSATVKVASSSLPDDPTLEDYASALNSDKNFSSKFTAIVTYSDGAANGVVVTAKDGGTVDAGEDVGTPDTEAGSIAFDSATNAQATIKSIDDQLKLVSDARASIGALENRFASAVSTINTSITNLTAAKSRITDVDMASEMVSYSRANILSQSGTAMLAQANSLPQLALKLLG